MDTESIAGELATADPKSDEQFDALNLEAGPQRPMHARPEDQARVLRMPENEDIERQITRLVKTCLKGTVIQDLDGKCWAHKNWYSRMPTFPEHLYPERAFEEEAKRERERKRIVVER